MSSAFGNYTFLLTPGVLSRAISMTNRWEEVQLGHQKWFPATHWVGPWGGKSCLNSGVSGKSGVSKSSSPQTRDYTIPLWLVFFYYYYYILLNLISVFTIQSFYIFQLKKKNLQTEKFGKTSQWNASHLTRCCPRPSVSYLSIEGKPPAITWNHLEIETFHDTLPKRHLPPKPTFSAIDIVTIWGILCQLDIFGSCKLD